MANLTKASYRIISVLMTTIHLNISPATANDEQTKQENAAFKEAVQAVKDKNYIDAIALFEEQAKLPRHDELSLRAGDIELLELESEVCLKYQFPVTFS